MKLILRRKINKPEYDTHFSVAELLVLSLLLLAAINIYKIENYLFFAICALLLFLKPRFVLSQKVIAVFLFSFVLMVFRRQSHGTLGTLISTFIFLVCFIIGYCLTERQKEIGRQSYVFLTMAVILSAGNLLHLVINVVTNLDSTDRNLIDIWTGSIRSATSQSGLALGAVTVSVAILFADVKKRHKVLAIAMLTVALWCNLYLAGRTLLVILLLCFAAALVYRMHISPGGRFRIAAWAVVIIAAVVLVFTLDLFGIQEVVLNSNFYNRFFGDYSEEISETGRWDRKWQYLQYVLDYPFGGRKIHTLVGGYAHDLYLDTYDEAGVLALVTILIVEVQSIRTVLKLLKQEHISTTAKMLALCILTGYHLMFFVEPIIAGMEWLLGNYLILYGSMACILRECNNIKDIRLIQ